MSDATSDGEAGAGAEPSAKGVGVPPYIPFQTLLTFLGELKENGMPPQIDNSVLRRFSGSAQAQLKAGLKYLGLLDGAVPTKKLEELVATHGEPAFDGNLRTLLEERYPFVFSIDLMTATPTMFADSFKVTGAKEDVSRKCRTFFLHAAKKAGVPLGQRILNGSAAPRGTGSGSGGRRRAKTVKPAREEVAPQEPEDHPSPPAPNNQGVMTALLSKFPDFDPSWPDEIKKQWFAGFDQFMKGAAKSK